MSSDTSIIQPQSLMQAAMMYASYGWRVFPTKPLSKEPQHGLSWPTVATTDPQQIVEWWTHEPKANIAIVAGTRLCVIDVDRKPGKPDGWLSIGQFIDQSAPWVGTPNNGFHFYYQATPNKLTAPPGVDIQTGTKYVLAPPSRLPMGPYLWGNPLGPPWDPGVRDLPFSLAFELSDKNPQAEDAGDCPELIGDPPPMPFEELKHPHIAFLETGKVTAFPSISELLHSLSARLYRQGYTDEQVLSMFLENPFIHEAAYSERHNSTQSELRARKWVWEGLKKTRYHKKQRPTGWAKPQEGLGKSPFDEVLDQALRLESGGDVRPILQELALINADAYDESRVIEILHRSGVAKGVLSKLLKDYKAQLDAKVGPHGIQWAHVTGDDQRPLGTVENVKVLLDAKRVRVRHNLMDHRIYVEGLDIAGEERFNTQLSQVRSWAAQHRMPLETVKEQLIMLAQKEEYHPFREWVEGVQWDGKIRIQDVINTIGVDYQHRAMRDLLVSRWLISVVASVWGYNNRPPRGVLTFTGAQQQGKTTWLYYLVPKGMYHQGLILRPDNRDSATKGLRYLIVELGEIGSTFKSADIEALKAYIGQREDVYRMSYAHDESIWQRRTVFAASANNTELLHDQTGNTRWWVLDTKRFDLDAMEAMWGEDGNGSELRQFWAEMVVRYKAGEAWDLTDSELRKLEEHQGAHMDLSPLGAMLMDTYAFEDTPPSRGYTHAKREQDIRMEIGWGRPFKGYEARELRLLLRKFTGQEGSRKKRVNLATVDGKEVEQGGSQVQGRYWYMPPLRNSVEEMPPFRPK